MTLFELQAWLGHRSPRSTQFYAKISAQTLARAYTDAGYFSRNVQAIEVLIDRDAVASGAAASGEPWQHYDLGHGYCGYTFFPLPPSDGPRGPEEAPDLAHHQEWTVEMQRPKLEGGLCAATQAAGKGTKRKSGERYEFYANGRNLDGPGCAGTVSQH